MIDWMHLEDKYCEGRFRSSYFRDDENNDELLVYMISPDLTECAEKCVAAFNDLTHSVIDEICKKLISCAKEDNTDKEFELPALNRPTDILNYCWFVALTVDMTNNEDEVAYAVEGEGDWGREVGFVIRNNQVVYVGADYDDYLKKIK